MVKDAVAKAMESVKLWLPKSTCIVVGPGLGTDDIMAQTALQAMQEARQDVRHHHGGRFVKMLFAATACSYMCR